MNRWYWSPASLNSGEVTTHSQSGIRLYDGDKRTHFEDGFLTLTNIRLLWRSSNSTSSLALDLALVVLVEEEQGGFTSSPKIILHLASPPSNQSSGPVAFSHYTFIKLSFRQGGSSAFKKSLDTVLEEKAWENILVLPKASEKGITTKQLRAGILGIERDIHAKQKEASSNINKAFEDLKNLMGLAQEMVNLSRNIASKIKDKTGEISSDETVQLRSYLLSLGVDDPVTKETVGSTTEYHKQLAKEICNVLKSSVEEVGGVMLLSEVYCRINRARGLHLLSPEDMHNACSLMANLNLPLRLFTFKSGIQVLQLSSLDETVVPDGLKMLLEENKKNGISAIEYARSSGVPLLLAQERMHHAERCAAAVRDESNEGVRFFPNLFFSQS